MLFCESCHFVSDEVRCPLCGNKKLSPVKDDDFCLLVEDRSGYCKMLADIFKENDIPVTLMPYGSGIETQFGLPLSVYRLFVPFVFLEQAKSIVAEIENAEMQDLKNSLLENVDKFNCSIKLQNKVRKKFKLAQDEDFFEYCISIIEHADKIKDESGVGGSHFVFCYSGNVILAVNPKNFEILSLSINK